VCSDLPRLVARWKVEHIGRDRRLELDCGFHRGFLRADLLGLALALVVDEEPPRARLVFADFDAHDYPVMVSFDGILQLEAILDILPWPIEAPLLT
jgi:hypothetical protein